MTLDSNVTSDHFVEVTSTIPGTSGIVDGHYNTIGHSGTTQIWTASGGTVLERHGHADHPQPEQDARHDVDRVAAAGCRLRDHDDPVDHDDAVDHDHV